MVFGRFEAANPNDRWTGDALHGPRIGGRKTYLFAFLDDHSRLVCGYRFGFAEDAVRLGAALQPALAARGVPASVYVDNGSAFVDAWLLRACAKLGVRLVHSTRTAPRAEARSNGSSAPCVSSSWSRSSIPPPNSSPLPGLITAPRCWN
ncbi:hypothetical protein MSAR_38090 [Mycolicibacterium sarraceniae]|uniref:Integrase catalytic domain-containing protein n=1 Tax=Mycolicibacterium sarraceniae TaxID=1534348 RepID=A0A7I7SVC2_9MYCO|nr:hypothetical protein MSAR_38090 [Mycolicibacterium sarraceniae]